MKPHVVCLHGVRASGGCYVVRLAHKSQAETRLSRDWMFFLVKNMQNPEKAEDTTGKELQRQRLRLG